MIETPIKKFLWRLMKRNFIDADKQPYKFFFNEETFEHDSVKRILREGDLIAS